jgi:hypothetical protein
MKYVYRLAIVAILFLSLGCAQMDNTPRHTADEVILIVKNFSAQCRVQTGEICG